MKKVEIGFGRQAYINDDGELIVSDIEMGWVILRIGKDELAEIMSYSDNKDDQENKNG